MKFLAYKLLYRYIILRITTAIAGQFLQPNTIVLSCRSLPSAVHRNLSDVRDVVFTAEDLDQLRLVVANVSLHNVHARTQEALECVHVQNCTR